MPFGDLLEVFGAVQVLLDGKMMKVTAAPRGVQTIKIELSLETSCIFHT